MKSLQELTEQYLKKFKVFLPTTLFPPDWNALKDKRCPICFNKLYFPRNGKIALCKGKKHKKPFAIRANIFKEVVDNLQDKNHLQGKIKI